MLSSRPSTSSVSSLSPHEPQLLRFRLRQLFLIVTLLSVLCGLLVTSEGPWPIVIGLGALLVAAHVLGVLIGTRLRDTSLEVRRWRAAQPLLDADLPVASRQPVELHKLDLPPKTPLAGYASANLWITRLVVAGALSGGIVGGSVIALSAGARISWAGWSVGTISCAVLGAWLAFLASSFSAIARHAWRHANEHGK